MKKKALSLAVTSTIAGALFIVLAVLLMLTGCTADEAAHIIIDDAEFTIDNTAWVNAGSANITAGNGAVAVGTAFSSLPVAVLLTMAGDPGVDTEIYYGSLTTAGFTIYATTNVTNNTRIDWLAVTE